MLADAVEASSRTLSDPSPAKIQGLVQKMINKVFISGQLDECELTLKDLHLIARKFTRVLTGIFHRRVEYSEPAEKVRDVKTDKSAAKLAKSEEAVEAPPSPFPAADEQPVRQADVKQAELKQEDPQNVEAKKDAGRANGETASSKRAQDGSSKKAPAPASKEAHKRLGM